MFGRSLITLLVLLVCLVVSSHQFFWMLIIGGRANRERKSSWFQVADEGISRITVL
jgi:hypothetical protein